jgi:hypothetical protein
MCRVIRTQMAKPLLLILAVCALASVTPAGAVTLSGAKGTGVMAAGCPIDAVASDVVCPQYPSAFTLYAAAVGTAKPTGYYRQRSLVPGRTQTTFQGTVKCLSVAGNTAVVGGVLTWPGILAGVPFVEYVVDNGASGDLASDLGLFPFGDPDLVLLPPSFPTVCPAPGLLASIYGYRPLSSGNVMVRQQTT